PPGPATSLASMSRRPTAASSSRMLLSSLIQVLLERDPRVAGARTLPDLDKRIWIPSQGVFVRNTFPWDSHLLAIRSDLARKRLPVERKCPNAAGFGPLSVFVPHGLWAGCQRG